jgi:hypothetical protein
MTFQPGKNTRTALGLLNSARNLIGLAAVAFGLSARAQSIDEVDQFNPAGIGGNN